MLDPSSDSFLIVVVGLTFASIASAGALSWFLTVGLPRRQLNRVERSAAAGDPDALRSMRFLDDLDAAFTAGSREEDERRNDLRLGGLRVRAEIRSVAVGSTRVERGTTALRSVTMTLRLLDDGRELSVTEYVEELYIARLLVGSDVTVFVDPLDPAAVTVGWDVV
jgi:hypothetical protein